ncbi:MAG: DUF5107 domain-containing protein [Anaerolineae bacterium]|nr:DUF5107 domain-containing protein [Anaerolineae bacterium]
MMIGSMLHRKNRAGLCAAVLLLLTLIAPRSPSIAGDTVIRLTDDSTLTGQTTFTRTTITIPTYPFANYLSQQTNSYYNISFPVLDWTAYNASHPTPVPHNYELLVLENDYLKVTLLPELGGRIYQFIDKTTGHNNFYQNPVIKPTGWGPEDQGWWLAVGGVEWCLPVEEHGYEWGIPWSWSVISSTTGVTITVRDSEQDNRLRAAIDIGLHHDRASLVVAPRIENPTSAPITYKFWLNAQIAPGIANKPGGNTELIFNADEVAVHSTGDTRLPGAWETITGPDKRITWPEYNGVDYSILHNLDEWLGFFEYPHAAADFTGVYDHDSNEGVVRVFPSHIARGSKGFSYGWGNPIHWSNWTDEDSSGVELHGGVAPTFWDSVILYGWDTLSWTEFWYPVGNIGTITRATRESTLGLQQLGDNLEINLQATKVWAAGSSLLYVWDRSSCAQLGIQQLPQLTPGNPYQWSTALDGRALEAVAVAHVMADDQVLTAYGPTDCLHYTPPAAHLGYGINVRDLSTLDSLVTPLEVGWIRLWDEYSGLPAAPLPFNVLFNIGCRGYINDMNAWRSRVDAVVTSGLGKVNAYEICNEPNVYGFWNNIPPDPARFTEMLCIADERVKAIDPDASIISGGLAPVGRIEGTYYNWSGHNIYTMDERTYLQAMLDHGAAACMDSFGYHPYGFASAPETDPDDVDNGFTFRGAEKMHAILSAGGYPDMPVWATEFNWFRRSTDDGLNCDGDPEYNLYFKWQEVSAQTQADYLVRAFEYADENWPWMHGMFVWNSDWHTYRPEFPCLHSRYYSLRRYDGTALGSPTPAYTQFAAMEKNPGLQTDPKLHLSATAVSLLADVNVPRVMTRTVNVDNTGYRSLTWTADLVPDNFSPGMGFTPGVPVNSGDEGEQLHIVVDTSGVHAGTYMRTIAVTGHSDGNTVLNSPQFITVNVTVAPQLNNVYIPMIARQSTYSAPLYEPAIPHGPSKIGVHAIGEGGTLTFVNQVTAGGGRVALVKGLSFGYLCDVKDISPSTITVGRWADPQYEAMEPAGAPAVKAAEYMNAHMQQWSDVRNCVDYWEILNESDPPEIAGHVWLAEFFKACMDIAEANGYKLALFSYSVGVPEIYEWQAIAETGVFARAQQGGHILSLHEYSMPPSPDLPGLPELSGYPMDAFWGEPLPQYPGQDPQDPSIPRYPDRGVVTGRYRHLYRDILIPRGEVIPLAITETNLMIYDPAKRNPIFLEEMAWYDDRLREDDYVLGMAIFTLGGGSGWDTFDYSQFLPQLADRVITLKDQ